MSFGIGHPPTFTSNAIYMCGGGLKGPKSSKEFNYLDSLKSYCIFSDLIVPAWSLWSPHQPCSPHIIPMLSPSSPHCPHSPQKVPMWYPWLWSLLSPPHVVSVVSRGVSVVSTSSPLCPYCSHIIRIAPRRSPWLWSPLSPPHVVSSLSRHRPCCPHVIPIIPMSSPHHLEVPHIIPTPQNTLHPPPPHGGRGWGPQISKNAIRFELIKIF